MAAPYRSTDAEAVTDAFTSGDASIARCLGLIEALALMSRVGKPADDVPATVVSSIASVLDDALREIEDAFFVLRRQMDEAR